MPKAITEGLARREREIMNAVFALGNRASAEEIRAHLTTPPSDSSVRVMLARLEKKGYLKHQQDGLRYLYSATISPAALPSIFFGWAATPNGVSIWLVSCAASWCA